MPTQQSLKEFQFSKKAQPIAELLSRPETIGTMEALSREGRPAVLAVDRALPEGLALDDTEKKHVGRWIRDVLAERGWRPRQRKAFRSGRIFASGAVYGRPAAFSPPLGTQDEEAIVRLKRAQELVAGFRKGTYTVDDFIRDKRREAKREL